MSSRLYWAAMLRRGNRRILPRWWQPCVKMCGITMPPFPVWFEGRRDIRAFLAGYIFRSAEPFRVRLVPLQANGSPAFAVYQVDASGVYRAGALHVLTIENGDICEIQDFLTFDGELFSRFGLPLTA